jgi:uncharacterized protein DUF6535
VAPQAGLFSVALTGFVIDSKQDLQVKPADETVYYLRQQSTILSQISMQLASIAPQVSIPSTPPAPFPAFSPSASNIRVNAFWFMALAFSLIAALLVILVQKWVRDYMRVLNRYSDPLKSARLRQYLYEGCRGEGWHMPRVVEAVPGFLHVSLLLFFVGLGDSLLNINTTIGISTIVPIGICGLLYFLTTFLPIISPQSPYQNSFSGIFWFMFQKLRVWKYRDQGHDGELKAVDTNMAQGRMQLAMEETDARKGRDVEAIRWLIDNLTEDAEMERFLLAIPGSFNTEWGVKVWNEVAKYKQDESDDTSQDEPAQAAGPPVDAMVLAARATPVDRPYFRGIHSVFRPITHLAKKLIPHHSATSATTYPPVPYPHNAHPESATAHIKGNVVLELSERVNRSLVICKSRGLFETDELWRKRTRACVETTALLACCANAKFPWFGDIVELLGDIGTSEKTRESSLAGRDQLFVMRWTCLSLVAIRQNLENNDWVQYRAMKAVDSFARRGVIGNREALAGARKIDKNLQKASECLTRLYHALREEEDLTEEVKEILSGHESEISELERLSVEADNIRVVDDMISSTKYVVVNESHRITSQIPGVLNDHQAPVPFSRFAELSRDPLRRQFIYPVQTLESLCSPAPTLRKILGGEGNADEYKELLQNLRKPPISFTWEGNEIQRQLWRLQDLRDGGWLGFTVELFFIALKQLYSKSSSTKSHSALYTGTFRAITSDWSKHKHSPGTQRLLLDIAWSRRQAFSNNDYPTYIVDEFLSLLGNIFEGQTGSHIDDALREFESFRLLTAEMEFIDRVLRVITKARAQSS